MALNKIERIDKEIQKTREKIAEYQNKLKGLEAQKTEAENLEITRACSFDMTAIQNRRFMYSAQTGELILGRQYKGAQLHKSHAEEHFDSGAEAPFDSFVRGWVGTGPAYRVTPSASAALILTVLEL